MANNEEREINSSYTEDGEDFLAEINKSLGEQVKSEIGEEENLEEEKKAEEGKRMGKNKKIALAVFVGFLCFLSLLLFTPAGKKLIINIVGNYIYSKFDKDDKDNSIPENPIENTDNTNTGGEKKPPLKIEAIEKEDEIINILLLGVEASNTDVMVLASLNPETSTVQLISLMRDLYVQIPGYQNNKLNAAYGIGGIELLYKTIELNFGIYPDGYMLVNYNSFETIVDKLEGITITLTRREANYLNTTNYISNPRYRTVKEGSQIMNGNQALGYSRIRYVSTGTEIDDYGRTQRHRIVLNAIFDKLKTKNLFQMLTLSNDILESTAIKTDITQKEFNSYLEKGVNIMGKLSIENHRIPSDGSFRNEDVIIGRKKSAVLVPKDWDKVHEEIKEYIYGKEE